LRSGNNLSAAELTDSLQVLNDLLDSWSAKSTLVFVSPTITTDQNGATLTLVPSKQTYTLGNLNGNENFLLARPPQIPHGLRVSIIINAGSQAPNELPMDMYDDVQWQGVPNKATPSIYPQVCYPEWTFPDMTLSFWPVPTQASPVVIYGAPQALTQFPDLVTAFSFPTGYARAIRYNLALDLFDEFSGDPGKLQGIAARAAQAKGVIESLNSVAREATCDPAILGSDRPMGNIFSGGPSRNYP
jgi:hypothetical protein